MALRGAPPHSVEAEQSVLGAVLRSAEAADLVFDGLEAADFYAPQHRMVFTAMRGLYDDHQPIDTMTVSDRMRRAGELEKAGGVGQVARLWDLVPSAANVGYYLDVVAEHSVRRRLAAAAGRVTELAGDLDAEIEVALDEAERAVLAVADRNTGKGLAAIGSHLTAVLEQIESLEGADGVTGLTTGLIDLDRKLGGLQPATLTVVAGRPGMGKSALSANIAAHAARNHGPVAYFSLEMSDSEIAVRLLSAEARVDSSNLRTSLGGDAWQRIVTAAARLYQLPLHTDSTARTVTDMRAKCRRLRRQGGLALVVVDYMQLMSGRNRENRQQEIADISLNLKGLARELDVPVIAVSQLNRAVEHRGDKRPQLGDLRESGAIEQDADTVLMIYRDDHYNPASDQAGTAEILVVKQRAGPTGTVRVTFTGKYTRFDNLAAAPPPATQRRLPAPAR